jgi:hypothetical protein
MIFVEDCKTGPLVKELVYQKPNGAALEISNIPRYPGDFMITKTLDNGYTQIVYEEREAMIALAKKILDITGANKTTSE